MVTINLPHTDKAEEIRRTESVIKALNFGTLDTNSVPVDHDTEETIEKTLELGFWTGLFVYPLAKPESAVKSIERLGVDRILIGDVSGWGVSDPSRVPLKA